MNQLFVVVLIVCCHSWSFAQTFSVPESVEWDVTNERWLIGNPGSGEILWQQNGNEPQLFASGCTGGPYGLEILNGVVYACDGSGIRGFSLQNGNEVFWLNLNAQFLNGLTTDGDSVLYATDFSGAAIYRINPAQQQYYLLAENMSVTPNGIVYDASHSRCVFATWGTNAPVSAIGIQTPYTISTLMTTNLGNCDGIARDQYGMYYLTCWSNGRVNRISPDFSGTPVAFGPVLTSPADIDIRPGNTDTIGIPESGANRVTFVPLGTNEVAQFAPETPFSVRYDGVTGQLVTEGMFLQTTEVALNVLTTDGREIAAFRFYPAENGKTVRHFSADDLPKGICLLSVSQGNVKVYEKVCVY